MIITYRYRVKDKTSAKHLRCMAGAVNYAWNYCCQIQREAESRWRNGANARWPSRFDFVRLMTGSSVALGVHSDTLGAVARQFVDWRDAYRRCPAWRSRKKGNLGWVPLNAARAFKIDEDHGAVVLPGRLYRLWFSRPLDGTITTAAFCEDARGRWYFNVQLLLAEAHAEMPAFYRRGMRRSWRWRSNVDKNDAQLRRMPK